MHIWGYHSPHLWERWGDLFTMSGKWSDYFSTTYFTRWVISESTGEIKWYSLNNVVSGCLWTLTAYKCFLRRTYVRLDQWNEIRRCKSIVTIETPIHHRGTITENPDHVSFFAWVTDTKYYLLTKGIYNVNQSATPHLYMNEQLLRGRYSSRVWQAYVRL